MRHNKSGRKLSMESDVRKAMLRNMTDSLIVHGRIKTTVTRAKELRKFAERMVTLAKKGTLASKRKALTWLRTKDAFIRLFGEYAETFKTRPGGYTRITKCGYRVGDNAPMAYIEYLTADGSAAGTTKKEGPKRKRRRSSAAKTDKTERSDKHVRSDKQQAKPAKAAAVKKDHSKQKTV